MFYIYLFIVDVCATELVLDSLAKVSVKEYLHACTISKVFF